MDNPAGKQELTATLLVTNVLLKILLEVKIILVNVRRMHFFEVLQEPAELEHPGKHEVRADALMPDCDWSGLAS